MNCHPQTKEAYQLFHDGALALARAERNGIRCDTDYCVSMITHIDRQTKRLEKTMLSSELFTMWRRAYGSRFNPDSNDQMADILYSPSYLDNTPISYTDGKCKRCKGTGCTFCRGVGRNPSTNAESLEAANIPALKEYLHIKKMYKAQDYLKGFMAEQVGGIIHTNFNLHFVRSFRPSTDHPNLANVPVRDPWMKKTVRPAIKASPGHKLVCADFKGVEVSIAACYHHDPEMFVYLFDKTNDMHRDLAMRLYKLPQDFVTKPIRQSGKSNWVFPQFYGDWFKSCAESLWVDAHLDTHVLSNGMRLTEWLAQHGCPTLPDFEEHCKQVEQWMWFEKWPVYMQWKKEWVADYVKKGYFDTLTGFRCQGVMDRKQATNYPIQGSAFHCMLQCIIWMDADSIKENWKSRICNQIYDDMMIDCHPDEEQMVIDKLRYYMTEKLPKHYPWVCVPLEVDFEATSINGSWYEKSEKLVLQ
jgi:DNA polymerase I-like protein with 3'-5' exonuclease and polymerase domains